MTVMRSTLAALLAAVALVTMSAGCASGQAGTDSGAEPWGSNMVLPADLVKELAGSGGAAKPVIVCTASPFLYRAAHIPGAVLHGPAADPGVLGELIAWARTLPRETSLVIYCGCCPLQDCPNLRPAYRALKGIGLAKVRVLILPDSFRADWIERGYPIER